MRSLGRGVKDGGAATVDVLFVSHEASRTGAPAVLLHLQRWLRRVHPHLRFETALLSDGPLRADFAELGTVHLLGSDRGWWPARTPVERGLDQLGRNRIADRLQRVRVARRIRPLPSPSILYLNTIVSTPVLRHLPDRRPFVVCHAHELDSTRLEGLRPQDWSLLSEGVDLVIAASEPVRDVAVTTWGVVPERVSVREEFISLADLHPPTDSEMDDQRGRLGLAPDALLVTGAGTLAWRKGPDLFLQLAQRVPQIQAGRPVRFVWAGEAIVPIDRERLEVDIAKAGLSGRVQLAGELESPSALFAASDVLALTSREDPFPLVVLEHAAFGVPVVCFEGAGGIPGFVRHGGAGAERGIAVPYLDVDAMAQQLERLLVDQALRDSMGQRAAQAVRQDHEVDVVAPSLWAEVEKRAGDGGG